MKHALVSSPPTVRIVITSLHSMLKTHKDCIQKYKHELEKVEKTATDSKVKDTVHEMILVLEGKTYVCFFVMLFRTIITEKILITFFSFKSK